MVRLIDKGPLWEIGGIPNTHREYLKQLNKVHPVWIMDFPLNDFGEEFYQMYNSFYFKRNNHLMFLYGQIDEWYKYANHDCIGYNVYEGDNPPQLWINNINNPHIKELWVPSNYVKQIYLNKGITKHIKVVPHGVSNNFKHMKSKRSFKVIKKSKKVNYIGYNHLKEENKEFKNKYIFFGMGSIYGVSKRDRKAVDVLIKAFQEEFGNNKKVALVIKLNIRFAVGYHKELGKDFDLEKYLNNMIKKDNDNIYVIIQNFKEENLAKLYNSVDCGVFPARSEGFGCSQLEMISCEKPVITTHESGTDDFSQKSLRVNFKGYRLAEFDHVSEQRHPYLGTKWGEPSISSLKQKMRYVFNNPNKIKDCATKHGKKIRSLYDWNKIGKDINQYLSKKYAYKEPSNTSCTECLSKNNKIQMFPSEDDSNILRCPVCYFWKKIK